MLKLQRILDFLSLRNLLSNELFFTFCEFITVHFYFRIEILNLQQPLFIFYFSLKTPAIKLHSILFFKLLPILTENNISSIVFLLSFLNVSIINSPSVRTKPSKVSKNTRSFLESFKVLL